MAYRGGGVGSATAGAGAGAGAGAVGTVTDLNGGGRPPMASNGTLAGASGFPGSRLRGRRTPPAPYTLQDSESESTGVQSTWRHSASTSTMDTQTRPLYYQDGFSQTVEFLDAETQTDELESEAISPSVFDPLEDWQAPPAVADFLARVGPMMNAQLARNATSHAFDDYNLFTSDESDQVECLHTLQHAWPQPQEEEGAGHADAQDGAVTTVELPCTGISWTATGSTLCASFGRLDHYGWCNHRGGLATWNLFKRGFNEKPDATYDTMSCLMCVACHPVMPSIVAAGTFNGEVVVWDMNNTDEPLVARSRIDDYFHREPIARIEWMKDVLSRDYALASVSADGKVLFWSLANKLATPTHGFRLVPTRSMRRAGKRRDAANSVVGGTALSFSKDGKYTSSFIVASEGGGIFKCLIRTTGGAAMAGSHTELPWDEGAKSALQRVSIADRAHVVQQVERHARNTMARQVTLEVLYGAKPDSARLFPSPIDFSYDGHTGPVHNVDCSPFHRNLFLTCGADGRLNMFSMLSASPLTWYEPSSSYLFSVAWSRVRPLVFAAGDGDGVVHVFDLQQSLAGPVVTLADKAQGGVRRLDHRASAAPAYALAFNPRWRNLMAVGDGSGRVHVWKLGWRLSNAQPQEDSTLKGLVESWEDDGALA